MPCMNACIYCGNLVDINESLEHNNCKDFYIFSLDEMIKDLEKRIKHYKEKRELFSKSI